MRSPRPLNWPLVGFRHHDYEIQVAAFIRFAPSVGTKQPNLLRLKFRDQSLHGVVDDRLQHARRFGATLALTVGTVRRRVASTTLKPESP